MGDFYLVLNFKTDCIFHKNEIFLLRDVKTHNIWNATEIRGTSSKLLGIKKLKSSKLN